LVDNFIFNSKKHEPHRKDFYKKTKNLTFIESLMLVADAGIGTGILPLPYAIDKTPNSQKAFFECALL